MTIRSALIATNPPITRVATVIFIGTPGWVFFIFIPNDITRLSKQNIAIKEASLLNYWVDNETLSLLS